MEEIDAIAQTIKDRLAHESRILLLDYIAREAATYLKGVRGIDALCEREALTDEEIEYIIAQVERILSLQ